MFTLLKKIHQSNPFINFFVFIIILSQSLGLLATFFKSYQLHFRNEINLTGEIFATFSNMLSYIIALYFIDIVFLQPKKSFLKWQTWIQFIICLFICYIIRFLLLMIRNLLLYGNLKGLHFLYEVFVNLNLITIIIAYIYATRFWAEVYILLTKNVHLMQSNPNNKKETNNQGIQVSEESKFFDEKKIQPNKNYFEVVKNNQTYFVKHDDIFFIKAASNYMELTGVNGLFPVRSSLKGIKSILSDHFCQIHRSVIVNIYSIKSFKYDTDQRKHFLIMEDGSKLIISKTYFNDFKVLWKKKELDTF